MEKRKIKGDAVTPDLSKFAEENDKDIKNGKFIRVTYKGKICYGVPVSFDERTGKTTVRLDQHGGKLITFIARDPKSEISKKIANLKPKHKHGRK